MFFFNAYGACVVVSLALLAYLTNNFSYGFDNSGIDISVISLGFLCAIIALTFDRIAPSRLNLGLPTYSVPYLYAVGRQFDIPDPEDRIALFGLPLVAFPFATFLFYLGGWALTALPERETEWTQDQWLTAASVCFALSVVTVVYAFLTKSLREPPKQDWEVDEEE